MVVAGKAGDDGSNDEISANLMMPILG